ncbi:2'-5' RNA ligase [Pirellula staleyi DSM 6068]|uniref:RNA 2',3'-cyclic phosphodiesterase n=1 Tax=Pirellula staleyi (strain ATCC 27377 / DSM 6068 / ICPB 4128) TaxID=530564 RepID=D2R085_PIRSD|nr:RNA 2',3'-cyclic phosphodiesterase [Pirellula staleyi]ADB18450.1 2'-5' RNA ligase [Pirellula staleyi DSM 6068]
MRRIRSFIAVELSGSVIAKAQKLAAAIAGDEAEINWVDTTAMHLTLKFLGDVPETEMNDICRVVEATAKTVEPFELMFRGIGAFPDLTNPKSLWMGLRGGQEELAELYTAIDVAMKEKLGFPRERRAFQPHVTIGRIKHLHDPAGLAEKFAAMSSFDGDLCAVDEVTVFASFLGRSGPTYDPIGSYELG